MNNLIIAVLSIAFAAFLAFAGSSILDQTSFIASDQALVTQTEISAITADYQSLRLNLNRRPTGQDFASVYSYQSPHAKYSYSTSQTGATMANANSSFGGSSNAWQFMPACNGGADDCFCIKMNAPNATIYSAAKKAAKKDLNDTAASRIEFSSNQCDDISGRITNPDGWPANPPSAMYLTIRLTSGTTATGASAPVSTYHIVHTPVCPSACGSIQESNPTDWTCQDNLGATVDNSYCGTYTPFMCSYTTSSCATTYLAVPTPGPCIGGSETPASWKCYLNGVDTGNPSLCSTPALVVQACTTGGNSNNSGNTGDQYVGVPTYAPGCGQSPMTGFQCVDTTQGILVDPSNCAAPTQQHLDTRTCVSNATSGNCQAGSQCYNNFYTPNGSCVRPVTYNCQDPSGNTVPDSWCPAFPSNALYFDPQPIANDCTSQGLGLTVAQCSGGCGSGTPTQAYCNVQHTEANGTTYTTSTLVYVFGGTYSYNGQTYSYSFVLGTVNNHDSYSFYPVNPDGSVAWWGPYGPNAPDYSICGSLTAAQLTSCTDYSQCQYPDTQYGPCSSTCGYGSQNATYTGTQCTDPYGNAVSTCPTAPATRSCQDYSGCTYQPTNVTYTNCAPACGNSTYVLDPTWQCTDQVGQTISQSTCPSQPAPTQGSCVSAATCGTGNSNGGNGTYVYQNPTWGACQPTGICGANSTMPVTGYTCQDSYGNPATQANCQSVGAVPQPLPCQDNTPSECYTYSAVSAKYTPATCPANGQQSLDTSTTGWTCMVNNSFSVNNSEPGCQALVGSPSLPTSCTCTPGRTAQCQ